ncbi:methionyl-tRNA formyltransferase [Kwoniella mangroviensis CBS 10435]|uniref:methionyl-tRNA formyltransferase n=1 Tax=Kwoniella mangroviensis CBS 10435 TaxID=1331196 RepID=A0A1B9IP00_9TREE|nr:methionyl-tRNA formyltransferase [Kwoniella mangroviensis CBS 10435]OCF76136.1 methionyl-tRNA formyltransferase [Kwoniella mangroviensis CBS 8886]
MIISPSLVIFSSSSRPLPSRCPFPHHAKSRILSIVSHGRTAGNPQAQTQAKFTTSARLTKFKILFCGSDEFSVASLKAVHGATGLWDSIDVVVPPEREIGRGGKHNKTLERYTRNFVLTSGYIAALRQYALSNDLPTHTVPSKGIKGWNPPEPFTTPSSSHVLLTASFGHIIPLRLLKLFPEDHRLNVHPSLLPRWRGAAPIQWTIASGDEITGVSVQRLVKYSRGVDAGGIIGSIKDISVPSDATYTTFLPLLAEIGGSLLVDVLRKLKDGNATFTPQDESQITYAPKITHETARIKWDEQSADDIDRLHRGISHQVHLWTLLLSTTAHFITLRPLLPSDDPTELDGEIGKAHLIKDGRSRRLFVACAKGTWLEVLEVQMAGKKPLKIKDWWNGLPKYVRDQGCVQMG